MSRKGAARITSGALVVLVVVAPSCRQVAGIHVVQSQQEECTSCVDSACGSEASTCLATASCAARLDCALACDPSAADCIPGCQVQAVGDADDLGAVQACIASSCASTCGLSWGGLLPPVPPSAASACASCIASSCSSSDAACAKSTDCSRAVECARAQSTPDALDSCEAVRYPVGAPIYAALATCVQGSCTEACGISSDWSCVGKVSWPEPTGSSIVGNLTVVNIAAQSQGLPGLSVVGCFASDVPCSVPVGPPVVTDANGNAVITLPTSAQSGQNGFVGFLSVTDPTGTYTPTRAYPGYPLTQTGTARSIVMGTTELGMATASLFNQTYDPTRATVIVSLADCAGAYGQKATFSVAPSDSRTIVAYTRDYLPSLSATATDSGGTAIIADALPGQTTITTRVAGVTPIVATTSFFAEAGTLSIVLVTPTP